MSLNPAMDWELSVRNFRVASTNRVVAERSTPAGKGVNVAVALAAVGLCVGITGFVGKANLRAFTGLLQDKGICNHMIGINGSTRLGIKVLDIDCDETTEISFPGVEPTKAKQKTLNRILDQANCGWVVLSGSLPPGVDTSTYATMATRLRARGVNVAVDSSGEALARAVKACPTVIKPNLAELEELCGRSLRSLEQVSRAARKIVRTGVELAVISMGTEGALFMRRDECFLAVPPRIKVRSTVGAGDAMMAGTILSQLRGLSLEETARLATGFSLRTISASRFPFSAEDGIQVKRVS